MCKFYCTFAAYLLIFNTYTEMQKLSYIILLITMVFVGCDMGSSNSVSTSSETRVHSFSFYKDTANIGLTEATYKIEHLADTGLIYCIDSLRYGTRLDSVIPHVTYKETPASATFYLPDTIVVSSGADTLNFSKGPIYLHIKSSKLCFVIKS